VSEFLFVQVERDGDAPTIWLNRSEKRKILGRRTMEELTNALRKVGDSDVRGVVLAGVSSAPVTTSRRLPARIWRQSGS